MWWPGKRRHQPVHYLPAETVHFGTGVNTGRMLRIRVYESGSSEAKVNVNVPLGWAKFMAPFIESKIKSKLADKGYDVDLGKIQEAIDSQEPMKIVDVQDGGDKVEIFIE